MTTIQTSKGLIKINKVEVAMLRRLQNLLPFGIYQFNQTFNGADFGVVMCCGNKEVYCLKQQPLEVERPEAEQLFLMQHLMIMDAYCEYIKMEYSGAYLAAPYLRQRNNELWEAGVSHFIFPSGNKNELSDKFHGQAYDSRFGEGATSMFGGFLGCFTRAFNKTKIPMPPYLGIDIRTRSHLKNLAMNFMVLDAQIICLRANLREQEDAAWAILSSAGISNVYHLPAIPMTIQESDLDVAKGVK